MQKQEDSSQRNTNRKDISQTGPGRSRLETYRALIRDNDITIFEYYPMTDLCRWYDGDLEMTWEKQGYLADVEHNYALKPEDRSRFVKFCREMSSGVIEIDLLDKAGKAARQVIRKILMENETDGGQYLLGWMKDITSERERERLFEERAMRDSMTKLYNHSYGKELIEQYLLNKTPYTSCGMMVVDIDYFKNVNDAYGHLFGDKVLVHFAILLTGFFKESDIIVRAGGDEFVIFLKEIGHNMLIRKAMDLVKAVQQMKFTENDYSPTCSVGVCYLPENVPGYGYDQLFQNADWALYQAKENGRNRYVFCDNLRRFEEVALEHNNHYEDLDARYFQNDVVATAFEIFEKMGSFNAAMERLLKIIGIRFQLDRITVIRTDIKEKAVGKQFQWCSEAAPEVLQSPDSFTKEDFLTLFQSYDEYGTTVLNYDDMEMYSGPAARLLMQGEAKTVLYAAMYCEGRYTGAISYVTCGKKRFWTKQKRRELGEITKIISSNLAKKQAMNASSITAAAPHEYDHLTGLLSFARFREEVERIIVGGYADSYAMVYSDFENFKYYNQKFGYATGDQLLKEFANYIIGTMEKLEDVYFTRVVSDQFLLFMPYDWDKGQIADRIRKINDEFVRQQVQNMPEARIRIRAGIFRVTPDCLSAAAAIDAANYARKRVRENSAESVIVYSEEMGIAQTIENEIIDQMDQALKSGQFCVYMQPKFSLITGEIEGAEALIRWHREDGTILMPDAFIPLYEANGRITELDFYVFEQVADFLSRMKRKGRKLYPISVNASILHARDEGTVLHYREILDKYGVDHSLVEIELTETATVSNHTRAKRLFEQLQAAGFHTALDDFGAGYSILNMVIDIPVNTVKLDRVFINNCETSKKGVYFLEQIISLVKNMGYHVLCEGVETREQAEILKRAGCSLGQGFLVSKPVPIDEFEKMLYGEA